MLDATAYIAVAAGYLLAVLVASHLTLLGLLLLTALNAVFLAIFRRMSSEDGCSERETVAALAGGDRRHLRGRGAVPSLAWGSIGCCPS